MDAVDFWVAQVVRRHVDPYRPAEFLKASRALSARYVERRADLPRRSPLDSAGKRSAFAVLFGLRHFFTVRAIVRELDSTLPSVGHLTDLGCGTGVAAAAWALSHRRPPRLAGVDRDRWAVTETAWTWRALGLSGVASRGDLVRTASTIQPGRPRRHHAMALGWILAWSVNELAAADRHAILGALLARAREGGTIVLVEPLASSAAPWWSEWVAAFAPLGGVAREWRLGAVLPPPLAALESAAGFRRDDAGARSLVVCGAPPGPRAGRW